MSSLPADRLSVWGSLFVAGTRDVARRMLAGCGLALLLGGAPTFAQEPPAEKASETVANAKLIDVTPHQLSDLGLIQGVSEHDGKLYIYGDLALAEPRVGMIREFDRDLKPTGRFIRLTERGRPVLCHPTGLTWSERHGTFLGDTFEGKATIYRLDWERALNQGHLDDAVLGKITDDAATNGCRPLFVTVQGKEWLATADYGDVKPEIRLLDPVALVAAGRTSAPGVIGARLPCGPFNQNLAWEAEAKRLTCIQNTRPGDGWRLDVLDLERAVAAGRIDAPGARIETLTFPTQSELEGYLPLGSDRGVFVAAELLRPNTFVGRIERTMRAAPAVPMKSPAP